MTPCLRPRPETRLWAYEWQYWALEDPAATRRQLHRQLTIRERIRHKVATLTFKAHRMSSPPYLSSLLNDHIPSRMLRPSSTLCLIVPRTRTELAKRAFCVAAPSLWNSLPVIFDIRALWRSGRQRVKVKMNQGHWRSTSLVFRFRNVKGNFKNIKLKKENYPYKFTLL